MAERTRIGRLDEKGYKADNAVIGTGGCATPFSPPMTEDRPERDSR